MGLSCEGRSDFVLASDVADEESHQLVESVPADRGQNSRRPLLYSIHLKYFIFGDEADEEVLIADLKEVLYKGHTQLGTDSV